MEYQARQDKVTRLEELHCLHAQPSRCRACCDDVVTATGIHRLPNADVDIKHAACLPPHIPMMR